MINVVSTIILVTYMTWLSLHDMRHREFKSFKPALVGWVLALLTGYLKFGFSIKIIIGFTILLVPLYLIELIVGHKIDDPNEHLIGGFDIVVSPLYTVWFGGNAIAFIIALTLVLIVFGIRPLRMLVNRMYVGETKPSEGSVPLLLCLEITFLVALIL